MVDLRSEWRPETPCNLPAHITPTIESPNAEVGTITLIILWDRCGNKCDIVNARHDNFTFSKNDNDTNYVCIVCRLMQLRWSWRQQLHMGGELFSISKYLFWKLEFHFSLICISQLRQKLGILCIGQMTSLAQAVSNYTFSHHIFTLHCPLHHCHHCHLNIVWTGPGQIKLLRF